MALVSKTFSQIITFTRASTGTYTDNAGVLQTAAVDAPRFDYVPTTLAPLGFLVEEARTNGIRNNTMVGAVAGTPGTLPTNWTIGGTTTGLTISVVGTGTANGITYIDIRFNGTAGAALNPNILFDTSTAIAATNGQAWSWSFYTALVGGSLTNVTNIIAVQAMYSSTPTLIGTLSGSAITPTSAALITQRQVFSTTLNQATTAFVRPQLQFSVANGAAIDITLRIGLPQLELGAFATSVIPTTTAAVTRAADVASINTLSPWFNNVAGTLYAEYRIPYTPGATQNIEVTSFVGAVGVTQNGIAFYVNGPSGKQGSTNVWVSGTSVGRIDTTTNFVAGTNIKYATAYAANDRAVTSSGTAPATSATAYTPPTINYVSLGGAQLGYINGYLQRITYYPRRLTNTELQALTA